MSSLARTETRAEPRRPVAVAGGWISKGVDPRNGADVYDHIGGLRVVSSVHLIPPPEGHGLEYHVSVSMAGRRATPDEARRACAAFGMEGADEDNHVRGGIARHFWLPVGEKTAASCECKAREEPTDEGGGYITRPDRSIGVP